MACLFQCDLGENGIQRMKLLEKRNKKYLKGVKNWLQEKGLTDKTITKHITALFINDYLNYYDVLKDEESMDEVITFVTTWFTEKCMWASRNKVKDTAVILRKFYQYMCENNYVFKEYYEEMCSSIKDNIDTILEEVYSFVSNDYDGMSW